MLVPSAATGNIGAVTTQRILVVEDDINLADVVRRYLEREGFEVEVAGDGVTGLQRALDSLPDLVVLDLMLPGLHGIEVCRRLRQVAPVPVVILTARGSEEDRVLGLDIGADDYVAKPFSPRELTARIRAVLRRASTAEVSGGRAVLRGAGVELNMVSHEARRDGVVLALTAKEFDLLAFFMANPSRAFSREELLREVWGYEVGDTATVTVHARRLREKIEDDPSAPCHIVTVRSVGYRFDS